MANVVRLSPHAEVRLDEDLRLVLSDGATEVVMALPDSPDAWLLVRSIARRIEEQVPEVRSRTVLWHPGPLTGPVGRR